MEGEGGKSNGPIQLDWGKLLPDEKRSNEREEEEPLEVVLVPKQNPAAAMAVDKDESERTIHDQVRNLSDQSLKETLSRLRGLLFTTRGKLKDNGAKLEANLKCHERELERRQSLPLEKEDDGFRKSVQLSNPDSSGTSADSQEGAPSSTTPTPSKFAACFTSKLDKKQTDSKTGFAFHNELSTLNPCGNRKMRSNGKFSSKIIPKGHSSSREAPCQSPGHRTMDVQQQTKSNHDRKGRWFDGHTSDNSEGGLLAKRKKASEVQTSNFIWRGKGRPVILDDEEGQENNEITHEVNNFEACTTTKIYYPSSGDPEAVEICYSDLECLAPEGYLTSTMMNFYIRYLQELMSPTETGRHNYHIFNTYFYEKLKEAVLQKNTKETSFVKFRRWWKGINLFEKAYILLPINENLHWSLVIICIPDKADDSGLFLLHLDSLGLHRSKSILSNIKSFLIEEWNFLRREDLLHLPIADSVWERLSRRIDEKEIEVPQQRNEYDCGLFVLFFMQRFIKDAPKRLTKKDLSMFGKHWFHPEDASSLRQEIRHILKQKFIEASK